MHIKEFKYLSYTHNEIGTILKIVKPNNIKQVHIYRDQKEEAKKLAIQRNVPKKDALHAISARDNDLQLISRDKHFEKLKDITRAKLPKDA